ncbi:plasminogen receptor (KT) isoform X1 [Myotis daubentonii]|uniref:plasminogen receptor (KT) isoform X1 n=2 Tax=Myotis daubentonii TaxID=98922 RepID=UPI00287391DA|nr:plasminogen receptor (KT) isoform X1 [Myotis daubentonii]XP_059512732.1 plasminogen receptor (KT) isoform X1 [Myotis daubentonii]XP_059512733.1 plasminogen receptor (KT) isoform X1 [Myotis daubentonii]XP_059512734.1 plasminogen receptor (KT) isoform X1 [Myotis daubentonii]
MGFIFSKSMNENMKNQQEFMLMNARLQLERQLMMQNEMRERQMAMQVAWSREFLKYFGTFFGIAAISLTAGAIKRKKPAFLFPIIPLGFVLTYQYDLGYGTLLQRMKEIMPFSTTKNSEPLNMRMEFIPSSQTTLAERQPLLKELLQQASSKDINLNFEEFKKNGLQRQSEAENKSLSELKNIRLVKHFLKKRQAPYLLSDKCCNVGCTKKEVAVYC